MIRPPPRSPLFPYPTLSRSILPAIVAGRPSGNRAEWRARAANRGEIPMIFAPAGLSPFWLPTKRAKNAPFRTGRSEEHTSELQSRLHLVCRLLLEKKKKQIE